MSTLFAKNVSKIRHNCKITEVNGVVKLTTSKKIPEQKPNKIVVVSLHYNMIMA